MSEKKTVDNLLDIARGMLDKKLEQQKAAVTDQINNELNDVRDAIQMVKFGLCYKIIDENGWHKHYIYATEDMLITDYLSDPKNSYCRRGISFEEPDIKAPWKTVFTVNGYKYYDIRYLIQRYQKDLEAEKNRILRYGDTLNDMIREFDRLVEEHRAVKKMLDDWTRRLSEGENTNA